ncbi:MAG: hypothetical protein M3439_10980 [Chloroflexota bacterium]|nr:hypothetical protein [Chloroflexota bacterium]
MALEEYMESEVVVAVAATAALLSPRVRGLLRRGVVSGLAGVLMARDALTSAVTTVRESDGGATAAAENGSNTPASMPRRGVVSGLATVMTLGDTISSAVQDARTAATTVVREAAEQAKTETTGDANPSPAQVGADA